MEVYLIRPVRRRLGLVWFVELVLAIVLFWLQYSEYRHLDTGYLSPSFYDASGYLEFAQLLESGDVADPGATQSFARIRRPPGFPIIIALVDRLFGGSTLNALADFHFYFGIVTLLLVFFGLGNFSPPGFILFSLVVGHFFSQTILFQGAIPEWTVCLLVLLLSVVLARFFLQQSYFWSTILLGMACVITLIKAALFPLVIVALILTVSMTKGSRYKGVLVTVSCISPLFLWCTVNLYTLGRFAPGVDIGFNLFSSASLISGDLTRKDFPSDVSAFLVEVDDKLKRPQAGDLVTYLDSGVGRVGLISPQDINIGVGLAACKKLSLPPLECESVMRRASINTIVEVPLRYLEYVASQFIIRTNRDWLVEMSILSFISIILFCFNRILPNSRPYILTCLVLCSTVFAVSFVHAALVQLYYRYVMPFLLSLRILFIYAAMQCLSELLSRPSRFVLPWSKVSIGQALKKDKNG